VTPGGLATAFDAADESPGFLLWQVTNRWQAAQRATLKPLGLTHVQFVLLASLSWLHADGPVSQRDLAEHASTDPMMTSQVLRVLEARGLVERAEHPSDRRAWSLRVTEDGRHLADRAVALVEACDATFFSTLDDVAGFSGSLRRLANR
jgi:DNA-binding MarR family transcriptional regulator